jgi:AAA domain
MTEKDLLTGKLVEEFDDDATPPFADKLLTRSDLRDLPDPEPLIDNVLDQGTTALLYGSWGTLKTFIALDWAACAATGHAWQGRTTEKRRVLYVVGEGAFGFKGRVDAWETGWQVDISDEWLSILPVPVNLLNTAEVNNLRALIEWADTVSSSSTPWPGAWWEPMRTAPRTAEPWWTP